MTQNIGRPEATEYTPYFGTYISKVEGSDILGELRRQLSDTLALLQPLPDAKALHRYAPGKWSVKEVLGHIIDAERVFSCRALRFARGDSTPLPSFDQDSYVAAAQFDRRPWEALVAEFQEARRSTLLLLESFQPDAWLRRGVASDREVSVRALAYVIAGHAQHHLNILRERYGFDGRPGPESGKTNP